MTIETPPTAAAVRIESRLRPEQVNVTYANDAALEADIAARITRYKTIVEKEIADVDDTEENQTTATEALTQRVLASLYGSASPSKPFYRDVRTDKMEEYRDLLGLLKGTADSDSDGTPDDPQAGSFSMTLTRKNVNDPEYSYYATSD